MCTHPTFTWVELAPDHRIKQPVQCRKCWQCRYNRVSDYVGRVLCENAFSKQSCQLTLTYRDSKERDNDLAHKLLTPKHVKQFVKNLRNEGHKIRYLVCGEHGSLYDRTHFHMMLFGTANRDAKTNPFQIPNKKNYQTFAPWSHGYTYADQDSDEKAARYCCKYILHPQKKGQRWFSLSKKPPLGAEFFEQKARRDAELGVFPSSFSYMPPGGNSNRAYYMTGTTRRNYLATLLKYARTEYNPDQMNEWVEKAVEKVEKWEILQMIDDDWYKRDWESMQKEYKKKAKPVAFYEKQIKADEDKALWVNYYMDMLLKGEDEHGEAQAYLYT